MCEQMRFSFSHVLPIYSLKKLFGFRGIFIKRCTFRGSSYKMNKYSVEYKEEHQQNVKLTQMILK